ncbi:hypothetical protein D3C72_179260 [compost metagenome]
MSDVLSLKALNRATLARQMLLRREAASALDAVARLAGLQAQVAKPPYLGLWSRLEGFRREELLDALYRREVIRATAMRGTLHVLTASDYVALRPVLQPMLSAGMASTLRARAATLDVAELVAAATAFFEEKPRTFTELRAHLMGRYPDGDERAMGFAVRTHLPLAMVPNESTWGFPADSDFTTAAAWLGTAIAENEDPTELVRRYLAAFGPATVADAQTWSGLKGLKSTFEAMRSELVTFRDARKRELFDLPDAPRPSEETDAPVRFLPEYDNLVLAHADRSRLIAEEFRPQIVTTNLKVLATFLVDGRVAGTWKVTRKGKGATLVLEPFEAIAAPIRDALAEEGLQALRFSEEDAQTFDLKVDSPLKP